MSRTDRREQLVVAAAAAFLAGGFDGTSMEMVADRAGVTRLIDRMVRKGWVTRSRCTEDRRRVWCRITPPGLDLLAGLERPVQNVDDTFRDVLDEHELVSLIGYLDRLRAHLNADEG